MKKFPSWLKGLFVDFAVATLGGYPLAMLIGAPFVPLFFTIWAAFSFGRFWPRLNAVEVDENEVPVSPLLSALMRFNPSYKRRAPYSKIHETRPEYLIESLTDIIDLIKHLETREAKELRSIFDGLRFSISEIDRFYYPPTEADIKTAAGLQVEKAGFVVGKFKDTISEKLEEFKELREQSKAIDKAFEKLESLPPAPTLFLNEDDLKKAKKFSGVRREAVTMLFEAVLGHKDDKGNYLAPADDNFQADLIGRIRGIYEEIKNRPGTCLTDAEFEEHKNELKNQDAFRLMVEGVFYQLRVVCPAPSNCLFAGLVRNEAEETVKASAVDSILHLFQKTGEAMFGDDFNITYSWDEKKGETLIIKF